MRMDVPEAFSANAPFVFAGPAFSSSSQTSRRANSVGAYGWVTRHVDNPSQANSDPFVQKFSEFVASIARRSQSQPNSHVRSNSARQKPQHQQQQHHHRQHQQQVSEKQASTPRGSSTRKRHPHGGSSQRSPLHDQSACSPSLNSSPSYVMPAHAGMWTPSSKMVFVDVVSQTPPPGKTKTPDPSNMTPSPLSAPNGWKPIITRDSSVGSIASVAGLTSNMQGSGQTPDSVSILTVPTVPFFSEVPFEVADCSAISYDADPQNHRIHGQTMHRQHVPPNPCSAHDKIHSATCPSGDHFATWTKARETAEVVLQRADMAAASLGIPLQGSACVRTLSEPAIISRLHALGHARRRLSAGRRIAKLMALKAELHLQSTLDAWRIIIQEAKHRQEMHKRECQIHAIEVAAHQRAVRWNARYALRQTFGSWRSFMVSSILAQRLKRKKDRWQRPTLTDQVAVLLDRAQTYAWLQSIFVAWSRLASCKRRLLLEQRCQRAETLVSQFRRRCLSQAIHILGSLTFRVQVGALLSGWRRISDLAWRERALQLLKKAESNLPEKPRRLERTDENQFVAASEAAEWFRNLLGQKIMRDALLAWCSSIYMAHTKERLNNIADQMSETRAALAKLGAAARDLRLQRSIFVAWTTCLPFRNIPETASIDSLAFSVDSSVPPSSCTLNVSMAAMDSCRLSSAWQASATLPSRPTAQQEFSIHQPCLSLYQNACGLSETMPASLLNRAFLS